MNNSSEFEEVDLLVKKARIAQEKFEEQGSQQLFDLACQAVGWALWSPNKIKGWQSLPSRKLD